MGRFGYASLEGVQMSLSDKIEMRIQMNQRDEVIKATKVKQFIKELKEEMARAIGECDNGCIGGMMAIIYDLAGLELAGEGLI